LDFIIQELDGSARQRILPRKDAIEIVNAVCMTSSPGRSLIRVLHGTTTALCPSKGLATPRLRQKRGGVIVQDSTPDIAPAAYVRDRKVEEGVSQWMHSRDAQCKHSQDRRSRSATLRKAPSSTRLNLLPPHARNHGARRPRRPAHRRPPLRPSRDAPGRSGCSCDGTGGRPRWRATFQQSAPRESNCDTSGRRSFYAIRFLVAITGRRMALLRLECPSRCS
jgi:hypothetical protein